MFHNVSFSILSFINIALHKDIFEKYLNISLLCAVCGVSEVRPESGERNI